jgi:hypothetical protein
LWPLVCELKIAIESLNADPAQIIQQLLAAAVLGLAKLMEFLAADGGISSFVL